MDIESKHVIKFLKTLADTKQQFTEFSQRLRDRPEVNQVLHSLECLKYQSQDTVEGYINVELNDGKIITWWLEINWNDEQWRIESSVLLNDNQPQSPQQVIKEFPDRTVDTLDECIEQLSQVTLGLVGNADGIIDDVAG